MYIETLGQPLSEKNKQVNWYVKEGVKLEWDTQLKSEKLKNKSGKQKEEQRIRAANRK